MSSNKTSQMLTALEATEVHQVTLDGATFSRPFPDHQGRLMVGVSYEDGDRFTTYGVGAEVLNAWAEVALFGRQLTEGDV